MIKSKDKKDKGTLFVSSVCTDTVKSYPLIAATRSRCITFSVYGLLSCLRLCYSDLNFNKSKDCMFW